MESLAKQIYDLMERLLQNPQYRSILVGKNNNVLNFLLMAHHEAFCEEMKRKYGDRYE